MNSESSNRYGAIIYLVSGAVVALAAFETVGLFLWGHGAAIAKLRVLLALIGVYGIAIGFFARSSALEPFRDTLANLTSPNPMAYLQGNFEFAVYPSSFVAVALSPHTLPGSPRVLGCMGSLIWVPLSALLVVYSFVHLLVIAPLAYFPILLASAIVSKIQYSGKDIEVRRGVKSVSIRKIVSDDPVAAKGFVMGVPSLALALGGHAASLLFST